MSVERLHPTAISTMQGSQELGREVMAMRYDLVRDTLQGMLDEIDRQVRGDSARGRRRLVGQLADLRFGLAQSVGAANALANFCQPWIDEERAVLLARAAEAGHEGGRYESSARRDAGT